MRRLESDRYRDRAARCGRSGPLRPWRQSLTGVASKRWATAFTPELTGTDLPVGQQAAEVVRMLIDRINDPAMPVSQLLQPGFTLRRSTA